MQFKLVILSFLFTQCVIVNYAHGFHHDAANFQCRCRPNAPCWPSQADWQALNDSIYGNLVQVRPIGFVCHEPTYDRAACEQVSALSPNGSWRASQPGALQDYAWEVSLPHNETCYIGAESDPSQPCSQGRLPLYSAMVESVEQAQKAVRFAKEKNLRLVIKNTGHDAGGRSSAVDSFQILTYRLKNITFADDFVPLGSINNEAQESEGPAVTIGAGVSAKELYAAGAERGYTIVAGECSTVGIAGGYVQGGGVSTALAPMRGLVADLVLQFGVITADGEYVVANKYQNQDLFWALRGGGGGTFGLVTSVTMRVFPDVAAVVLSLYVEMPERNQTYWTVAKEVALKTRELSRGDNSGQYYIGRTETGNPYVRLTMFFIHETDISVAENAFASLLNSLQSAGVPYQFNPTVYAKMSSFLDIPQGEFFGGLGYHQENILISQDFYHSPGGPSIIVDQLAKIDLKPSDVWVINVLGGQVNANKDLVDNSVHPGWRKAAMLLVGNRLFGPTLQEQRAVQDRMAKVEGPILQSIERRPLGMYLNEAEPNLKDWQWWFWGENYGRLREIKEKRDPNGLFIVRHGVGSEEWDEDGMCRVETDRAQFCCNYQSWMYEDLSEDSCR